MAVLSYKLSVALVFLAITFNTNARPYTSNYDISFQCFNNNILNLLNNEYMFAVQICMQKQI